MLEITDVNFAYKPGRAVINNISLNIRRGEFLAVAGRNGSGKTTLTRLLMGLIKPTGGRILLDSADTASLSPADMARFIGYVFQNPDRQIFKETVREEVAYGPEQLGFAPEEIARIVEETLAVAGLAGLAEAYPRTLSKGQKQRVAIASALAMKPQMLILDEPTSGQGARERESLMHLLVKLNEMGLAIILVTHDMDLLARFAKRVVVMSGGEVVYDGPIGQLFAGGADFTGWGLREPVVGKLSRALMHHGVEVTVSAAGLAKQIIRLGVGRDA